MTKLLGTRVDADDLRGVEVPDGIVPVWGEDWAGRPVLRAVRKGYESVLRGSYAEGFDVDGPCASICGECHELLVSTSSSAHTGRIQDHYQIAHGQSVAMLP